MKFRGWEKVGDALREIACNPNEAGRPWQLDEGQRRSLHAIARRLPNHGVIVADEVGMGKTRIAVATIKSAVDQGGRVVLVVPPGLDAQWRKELECGGVTCSPLLRSLHQYFEVGSDSSQYWDKWSVVMVSHAFMNWRLRTGAEPWRWSLLPILYTLWRKASRGSLPRGSVRHKALLDERVRSVAVRIVETSFASLEKLLADSLWPEVLNADMYGRLGVFRDSLEKSVGLGLGHFDLVLIDEAHKSRGDTSALERLLSQVICVSPEGRRLALTATPVELEAAQWTQILKRISVDSNIVEQSLASAIDGYMSACREVKVMPSDADARSAYRSAAQRFKEALSPYLIRRDKREAASVKCFVEQADEGPHAYRKVSKINVLPQELSLNWRRAICAAEALSVVAARGLDPKVQRLRLTMGSGHGISKLLDDPHANPALDSDDADEGPEPTDGPLTLDAEPASAEAKKRARLLWWQHLLHKNVGAEKGKEALLSHPGLLAAVEEIEKLHQAGEKVLVFGRYTAPMKALVSMLNAREMLRALSDGRPWPQKVIHEDDQPFVSEAMKQFPLLCADGLEGVSAKLAEQYGDLRRKRQEVQQTILSLLDQGMNRSKLTEAWRFYEVLKAQAHPDVAIVVRALMTMVDVDRAKPEECVAAFEQLVLAAGERDESDRSGDDELNESGGEQWRRDQVMDIAKRLREDFGARDGGFARLMNGETHASTRRLLQLRFNRDTSFPRVLVAQSTVGREGLNLHLACRTVVVLHPEWNPGVLEQQIGRVDRLGSRWEGLLDEFAQQPPESRGEVPRIDLRFVVFQGTYDEHNWSVLNQRWEDLRSQLHGVVIPPSDYMPGSELEALADEINSNAPNFSPQDS